jgi:nickel-dependent lactate racemase
VPRERTALCWVVKDGDLHGLFAGSPEEAFRGAAELSAQINIRYLAKPVDQVLSMPAPMYTELWTAAKAMYKLEPVVADGGSLTIYAPGLSEISVAHGTWIRRVGYHVRDYFLANADAFQGVPRCVLAHSTHVKGSGTVANGVETPRINVVLATAIPEALCREVNLGYADPASIDPNAWTRSEGELVVPHAGEVLYRLEGEREG